MWPIEVILSRNITFVFDSLNLRAFDTSVLKEAVEGLSAPAIMDTPEIIVAAYPEIALIVQVGDRRVRVTSQLETSDLEDFPISDVALRITKGVPSKQSSLLAYGFNYDVGHEFEDVGTRDAFVLSFMAGANNFAELSGGEIVSFTPRIVFVRDGRKYDLILEPIGDARLKAHMNVHLEHGGAQMPGRQELSQTYSSEFAYFSELLNGIVD